MRRRPLLLLPALLGGCVSPPVDLYTLAAVPGREVPTARRTIELRRIGLAGYLDRSEIVRSDANYQLHITDSDRWGESFGRMLGRVLIADLSQRLPDATVFTEAGAVSTDADLILEIDIEQFDAGAGGVVTLLAQTAIHRSGTSSATSVRSFRLTAPLTGPTAADQAATMSTLLAQLADAVARMVGEERIGSR